MKRHILVAAFVLAVAGCVSAQQVWSKSQPDNSDFPVSGQAAQSSSLLQSTAVQESKIQLETPPQPSAKLSKKDRKRLEKQEQKAREQQRKEEERVQKKQAEEQRKQLKDDEERTAKERERELKDQEKRASIERKKEQQYEHKEEERAEKKEAHDINRHMEHEARAERAAASSSHHSYLTRIPVLKSAGPGLLLAQRDVSRAIYSQLPHSDVRVLLDSGNQIVLRGSATAPSLRQRLLQLAVGAARGYSVVDQLAANLMGDAASAATSAAIGGVSDLIHGSGNKNAESDGTSPPPPVSANQPTAYAQAPPSNGGDGMPSILEPGSNACANLSNSNQLVLTGQVGSQPSAELVRGFARKISNPSTTVIDQLAVRSSGASYGGNSPQNAAGATNGGLAAGSSLPALSPGSTVCLTENDGSLLLTGTVGSTAELGTVEDAVGSLVGPGRLVDQLTIANMNSAAQVAASPLSADEPASATQTQSPSVQSEVEQAVHSIPRLAGVDVQVMADGVHLSGSVDTSQDAQSAADLAREYAPGRPVVNSLVVMNQPLPPQR